MATDTLKKLDTMRRLREELAALEGNEQIKKLDKAVAEVHEVRERHGIDPEEFAELMLATFRKPKPAKPAKEVPLVRVKVGSKIEEWPATRTGRMPPEIAKLMNKHGAKNYGALVNLLRADKP